MRLIQEVTTATLAALRQNIIPTYGERIAKSPEKKDYYMPYLERAQNMLTIHQSILDKVETAL